MNSGELTLLGGILLGLGIVLLAVSQLVISSLGRTDREANYAAFNQGDGN